MSQLLRDLVIAVRKNATIDWPHRDSVRVKLRVIIKRLLKKHGYPPDKQETAVVTVLSQAENLCKD